nr:MAG TPA: hypothetical protein [Caudoviricetes sp.]
MFFRAGFRLWMQCLDDKIKMRVETACPLWRSGGDCKFLTYLSGAKE